MSYAADAPSSSSLPHPSPSLLHARHLPCPLITSAATLQPKGKTGVTYGGFEGGGSAGPLKD